MDRDDWLFHYAIHTPAARGSLFYEVLTAPYIIGKQQRQQMEESATVFSSESPLGPYPVQPGPDSPDLSRPSPPACGDPSLEVSRFLGQIQGLSEMSTRL